MKMKGREQEQEEQKEDEIEEAIRLSLEKSSTTTTTTMTPETMMISESFGRFFESIQIPPSTTTTTTTSTTDIPKQAQPRRVREPKMVIVIRQDLKMGVGKIASQACHACLSIYRHVTSSGGGGGGGGGGGQKMRQAMREWEAMGEMKVILRVESERELLGLETVSESLYSHDERVVSVLIRDAGRTQVASGTATALALFGGRDDVDRVTGSLKLL